MKKFEEVSGLLRSSTRPGIDKKLLESKKNEKRLVAAARERILKKLEF